MPTSSVLFGREGKLDRFLQLRIGERRVQELELKSIHLRFGHHADCRAQVSKERDSGLDLNPSESGDGHDPVPWSA